MGRRGPKPGWKRTGRTEVSRRTKRVALTIPAPPTIEEDREAVQAAARKRQRALLAGIEPEDAPPLKHEEEAGPSLELGEVMSGVSVKWLARVFKMTEDIVRTKLAQCTPVRKEANNRRFYALPQAASYLAPQLMDLTAVFADMRPADLPPNLKPAIWSARLKQQEWEVNAGHLWLSQDVLAVLSDVFTSIRTTLQLWGDTLEKSGLSEKHRMILNDLTDDLQRELHAKLVEMPARRQTRSQLKELDEDAQELAQEEISEEA